MKARRIITIGCTCVVLASCSAPDPGDTARSLVEAAVTDSPDRIHAVAVDPDAVTVTTVVDEESRSATWTMSSGPDQQPTRSGPTSVDQPSVDPNSLDVDDLVTRTNRLAENCPTNDWSVTTTAVTSTTTVVTEACGQQSTDHLTGTQLPQITQPFSNEGLASLWQELSVISPDALLADVLINTDALTARMAATPEQPTCEVAYQRDLAVPRARSVCRTPSTDRPLVDLGIHDAEEVWARAQVLAQTNGIPLTQITSLYLEPTGASDGSATLHLRADTREVSTVLKGDS